MEGDLGFAFIWVQTTDYRLQKQTKNVHYYPCTVRDHEGTPVVCCLKSQGATPFFFFFK